MLRVFDFQCKKCGAIEEHYTKSTESENWSDVKCSCGSTDVERIFTSPTDKKGLSHDGRGIRVPDGFKELVKQTMKTVPKHQRGIGATIF